MRTLSTVSLAIGFGIVLAIAFAAGLFLPDLARAGGGDSALARVAIVRGF